MSLDNDYHLAPCLNSLSFTSDNVWTRWPALWQPELPPAGWKIHISTIPSAAPAVLAVVCPLLVHADVPFKFARNRSVLAALNDGQYGLSQVGKFLTIYYITDVACLALLERLAPHLYNISGPPVPTDYRFSSQLPLYYRYGPYDGRFVIDRLGRKRRILQHPDLGDITDSTTGGEIVPVRSDILPARQVPDHLGFLRSDYQFLRILKLSAKGVSLLAVPRRNPDEFVVIKTAVPYVRMDDQGRDAAWGLNNEWSVLQHLTGHGGIPPLPKRCNSDTGVVALVRPYINGPSLWDIWRAPGARRGREVRRLCAALKQIVVLVQYCHASGIVVRDLSPANIIVGQDRAYVIDFELAHITAAGPVPGFCRGTPGFYDPLALPSAPVDPYEDIYALLSLIYMIDTDCCPGLCTLRDYVIESHTRQDTVTLNWRTMLKAYEYRQVPFTDLGAALDRVARRPVIYTHRHSANTQSCTAMWTKEIESSIAVNDEPDLVTVYDGIAGVCFVLAELELWRLGLDVLSKNWRNVEAVAPRVAHIPGLYFGISGLALAACTYGIAGEEVRKIVFAKDAFESIDLTASSLLPDLCQGVAGLIYAAVRAYIMTEDTYFRDLAVKSANTILALSTFDGGMVQVPFASGETMFGFAHGVAGIAWVMAFLQSYVPDKRYKNYLDQLAKTIVWTAIFDPATRTVTWPVSERNSLTWNAWCHGGPGILKGLIAISGHCDLPTESWGLRDVARTMIRSRFDSFSLCHGYASALDAVSDLFDAGRGMDRVVRREALVVRDTMVESCPTLAARPHPEGIRSMGLMTGLGGVVRTLARLNRTLARCNRMLP